MIPDISEIGEFVYTWDFDEEEYAEYLQENEEEHNDNTLLQYIMDNVSFDFEFLDNETFHTFAWESMYYQEIEDNFGEDFAREVLDDCKNKGEGRIETISFFDNEIDINNPNELNAEAVKLLPHGDYFKDCRGFILSNGEVVYTPLEHNHCTAINGIKGTYHFITLGNIRVLQNSIDIGKEPTQQQRRVLATVINSYKGDTLYIDIIDKSSEFSVTYVNPEWRYVIGEIDRYYNEGIKPQGRTFYESKKKEGINMDKKINLTEEKYNEFVSYVFESAFFPKADLVLDVKEFLDKNFIRQGLLDIDDNGKPTTNKTVMWVYHGQPFRTLKMPELLMLLDDEFQDRIKEDKDRKKFLKQIITDWYYKRKNLKRGLLSVNYL